MEKNNQLSVLKLKSNKIGRDFIIGDLHGCFDLLQRKLKEVKFDKKKDRLFCVGDLIDRGPDSMACIGLLYEPWFFATQGNHERMFLTWAGWEDSDCHRPGDFIHNGGNWVLHDSTIGKSMIEEWCKIINQRMPAIIDVGGKSGFIITHSEYSENSLKLDLDEFVWNRTITGIFGYLTTTQCRELINKEALSFVKLSELDKTKKIVYVGHNTTKHRVFFNNHYMLDTGAYRRVKETDIKFDLSLVEHKAVLEEIIKNEIIK